MAKVRHCQAQSANEDAATDSGGSEEDREHKNEEAVEREDRAIASEGAHYSTSQSPVKTSRDLRGVINLPAQGYESNEGIAEWVVSQVSFGTENDQKAQESASAYLSKTIDELGLAADTDKVILLHRLILLEHKRQYDLTRRLYVVKDRAGSSHLPLQSDPLIVIDWLDRQCALRHERITFYLECQNEATDQQLPETASRTARALVYQQNIIRKIYRFQQLPPSADQLRVL